MIQEIARRSSVYFVWMVVAKFASTAAFLIFGRMLGASEFGTFLFLLTLVQISTVFADVGVTYWQQTQAEHARAFSRAFVLRIWTTLVSICLMICFVLLYGEWDLTVSILISTALITDAMLAISDGYFLAVKRGQLISLKILSKTCITLVVFFLLPDHSAVSALIAYVVGNAVTALWSVPWRLVQLNHTTYDAAATFHETKSYALLSVTSFTYARADSFLVGSMLGPVALGNYGAAYRYLEGVSMIPTAIGQVLFPLNAQKKKTDWSFLLPLLLISTAIGIVVGILLYFFAPLLTVGILGNSFQIAQSVLVVFSVVSVLFFMNAPLATVIQSSSSLQEFLPFGIANTIANVVLNLLLIPLFGVMGAAYAMLLSEITGFIINCLFIKKVVRE